MRQLPSLDLHAHIETGIEPSELEALNAVVFAATRSLDEAERAQTRADAMTIWGVGCHPGLVGAQKAFAVGRFRELIERTAYAAELGLDGGSRVPMETQKRTLSAALLVLSESPRLTSLHSYRATSDVLTVVEQHQQPGLILHWWLGTPDETRRAIDMDCYFSANRSTVQRTEILNLVPLERILPETDHPFGDKGRGTRRPGEVSEVEGAIGAVHGIAVEAVRRQTWVNLREVVLKASVGSLLPRNVRRHLASV